MSEIKRILVATDFSTHARAALAQAIELAQRWGAAIDLLHVWEGHTYAAGDVFGRVDERGPGVQQARLEFAQTAEGRDLDATLHKVRDQGIEVRGRLESGDPAETIVSLAGRERYDLIVLGTHGRTGLAHALRGSVAEKVVQTAPCPVLTIHGDARSVAA